MMAPPPGASLIGHCAHRGLCGGAEFSTRLVCPLVGAAPRPPLARDPGCFPVLPACTRQDPGPQDIRSPGLCALAPSVTLWAPGSGTTAPTPTPGRSRDCVTKATLTELRPSRKARHSGQSTRAPTWRKQLSCADLEGVTKTEPHELLASHTFCLGDKRRAF